jgi:peptidoglycan hydrolase-like protein with peptidoglycan-binding domain
MPFILHPGAMGDPVARWQERLNGWLRCHRSDHAQLDVDGIFGPRTQAATRTFQRAVGIVVDGVVGPETGSAIRRVAEGDAGASGVASPTARARTRR